MLSEGRSAARVDASEASIIHSGASSHVRRGRSFVDHLARPDLPLDERKPCLRCMPRSRAVSTELREELGACVTSEGQGVDGRKSKRRRGGDIIALRLPLGKAECREGLRPLHSPPEGLRRKKGTVSQIASADVPLALGTDLGNKRRRRATGVCKETGGSHVEKKSNASQPSNGQTEENERRSERLKERRNLEKKKTFEDNQAIDWSSIRFSPARRKKTSGQRLQQKGNRGKTKVPAKKQVKGTPSHDTEKGMSSDSVQERHDGQGRGLTWTNRLRERGKKRVLEFCAEVEVETFAPNARLVKQKVEKGDETFETTPVQPAEETDDLFVLRWSRRTPRNFRTRARFQNLPKGELQLGNTNEAGEDEIDNCPSHPEEKQLQLPSAETTVVRSKEKEETELLTENGSDVCLEALVNPSVGEPASKSSDEKSRATSIHDLSAVEGRTEHETEPEVPRVLPGSRHLEALEAGTDKQIEIVLDLGIKVCRSSREDIEPITINVASSSGESQKRCEQAEASSPAAGLDGVCREVFEVRERQTEEEITGIKMIKVPQSISHKDVVKEKLVYIEEPRKCNNFAEDEAVECSEHGACSKLLLEVVDVVRTVDTQICEHDAEEAVEVHELTGCDEDASRKVVDGCQDKIRTDSVIETAVNVLERRSYTELIDGIALGLHGDTLSGEVVNEVVVEKREDAICTGVTMKLAVGASGPRAHIASEEDVSQEHIISHDVDGEKVIEVRDKKFGSGIAGRSMFESQDHMEKTREGHGQKFCDENSSLKTEKLITEDCTRCEISEEDVVEAEKDLSVCEDVMEYRTSDGGEHVVTDTIQCPAVEVKEGLENSDPVSFESGDDIASGSSDEEKGGLRGAEDSAGNTVDDFDVLAKYCRAKSRKKGSLRIRDKADTITVILGNDTVEDENLEPAEISREDPGPSSLKVSMSTGRSEPAEENGSEDQEETAGTRLQSLLDVVRIEVSATPELGDSSDGKKMKSSLQVSHTVQRTEEPLSNNAFTKDRAAKYSNDFKRGFVSLGLKCALCGGSSDGKWACDLRSARRSKGRDGSNYGSPKMSRLDMKESGKLQVKKGWLGRLLGPLSERVGVAGAWVHEECAVWSPEVYFAGVGRLKNVKAAIRRGRLLKCSHCGQPGATIGCRVDRCPQNYHLPCAHFDGCSFDHKKYLVACAEHLHLFPSRCRRFLEYGNDVHTVRSGDNIKDNSKLHRGNFRKMMIERRAAASTARLKDLEEEEKCMEKSGEDEEFIRRERKRLQRDLARIVPTKLGGRKTESEEITIPEGWNSVAGLQDVVKCLKEMVILPLLYPGAFDRLGIVPPRGVLLHGHSGTGKTLVVRALAGACARGSEKISYFARKGADCLGKYVGDAERQLRLLFQVAEQHQPSIIFFDEIDGLAPSRSRDGQDQTHSSVVSTLLALMDGLSSRGSVIVIGATNRPDALDPALRRPGRFDREIYFPLPSVADRAAILALHTRSWVPRPSAEVLSVVARGTRGFAGADLRALCVEVALKALKRVAPIHRMMESAERRRAGESLPRLPKIEVKASDWANALKEAPPPCSMRMTRTALSYTPGSPLPWYFVPSLLPALVEVLLQLHGDGRCFMPPALFKAVSFISLELKSRSELSGLRSEYRWMTLLQSGGHEFGESVEAALTSAGLVANVERLSDSGYVAPASGGALSGEPSLFDMYSSTSDSPKTHVHSGWGSGHFRILISGKGKRGQRLVAASIVAGFEGSCETRTLNLPTMLHEGDGDVIQGLNRILGAAKCSTPCMFFMPQIESWSMAREGAGDESPEECRRDVRSFTHEEVSKAVVDRGNSLASVSSTWSVFLQHIKCLSPDSSFMFLATSHLPLDELPSKVVDFFLSSTNKCKDKHVASGNQPVPCAVVQLPPLREYMAVVERASQEISRSLASRLVRFLNLNEESSGGNYVRATGRLSDPGFPSDEKPEAGNRDGSSDDGNECSVGAEFTHPIEQCSLQIPDIGEHSRQSSSPELTLKRDGCGRSYLEDYPEALFAPRTLPGSWSSEQKALQLAIAQLSHQIMNQAHFSDLRRISARIKSGPCLSTSLIDQRILGTANHYRSISVSGVNKTFEDILDRRDEKNMHASQVYGLVAIGLKGKSGLYTSGTEFVCDISSVLKMLRERVKSKVERGRDYAMYVPLLSKLSGLEDTVSSWSYQIRRLEAAARVSGGVKSSAPALDASEYASLPGRYEAREDSTPSLPESFDQKASFGKIHEKYGETSPTRGQSGDQNTGYTQPLRGNNGDAVTHSQMRDVVTSDKLAAEAAITNEHPYSQRDILGDPSKFSTDVHVESLIGNDVKLQDTEEQNRIDTADREDTAVAADPVDGSSGDGVCQHATQRNHPKQSREHLRSESLDPLDRSIRKMILAAWKEQSAESVELLYEIIAGCAASIRVMSDRLIREIQWTSDCPAEACCLVGSERSTEVMDGLTRKICLCPFTEAVRKLTRRLHEEADDPCKT